MKINRCMALLSTCAFACVALPADATDRIRAGQWVGTTTFDGKTRPASTCMTQSDADAMNGDAKAIRTYMEKAIPPTICKLTDIKVDGDQVTYTSVCSGAAANTVATTYHGDSFESTNTRGAKTEARWVGACK